MVVETLVPVVCAHQHALRHQIVRIKSFSSNTVGDVQAAVEKLMSKGASRIVVDLRGNVGGLLPGGIDTAGLFLDAGKVKELESQRTSKCSRALLSAPGEARVARKGFAWSLSHRVVRLDLFPTQARWGVR